MRSRSMRDGAVVVLYTCLVVVCMRAPIGGEAGEPFRIAEHCSASEVSSWPCYFDCESYSECGESTAQCCAFYGLNHTTVRSEVNGLAHFGEVCDHAWWEHADHTLNWCYGQELDVYYTMFIPGFGKLSVESVCEEHLVTDPCTGAVIQSTVDSTVRDNYETAYLKWDGITCAQQEGEWNTNEYGVVRHHITRIELSDHSMACRLTDASNHTYGAEVEASSGLVALSELSFLALNDNSLSGPLPPWLGSVTTLETLELNRNTLTGTLPEEWYTLAMLNTLEVESNELTGVIPHQWFNALTHSSAEGGDVTLACESTSGDLSVHMSDVSRIDVYGNALEGPLPENMACASIASLDLSHNSFHGAVPDFHLFNQLRSLDLSANSPGFTGTLPHSLAGAHALESLDVSDNALNGTLPSELTTLTTLISLSVANNRFSGYIPDLPPSLYAEGSNVYLSGDAQSFWCPFPNSAEAQSSGVFDSVECTCMYGHFCPGDGGGCEYNCTQCGAGRYANSTNARQCTECEYGKASNDTTAKECAACARGEYANTLGAMRCSECGKGKYSARAQSFDCVACERGRAVNHSGGVQCDECAYGYIAPNESMHACMDCAEGRYATDDHTHCAQCAAGKYARLRSGDRHTYTHTQCTECDPGTFANSSGATHCDACVNGSVAPQYGTVQCDTCAEGKFALNAYICVHCRSGEYAPKSGALQCDKCAVGRVSVQSYGSVECSECASGRHWHNDTHYTTPHYAYTYNGTSQTHTYTYVSGGWNTSCEVCGYGTVAPLEGSLECDACESGRYSPVSGGVVCLECAEGHASAAASRECVRCSEGKHVASNHSTCVHCAPGKYANNRSNVRCEECSEGTHAHTYGAETCDACARGKYTSARGAAHCSKCALGHYSAQSGAVECSRSPDGYAYVNATHSPVPCAGGTHALSGESMCVECGVGRYSSAVSRNCTLCPPGTYAPTAGAPQCTLLPPGHASTLYGLTSLGDDTLCDGGHFSEGYGAVECSLTSPGYYTPLSTDALNGNAHALPCTVGTYAHTHAQVQCSDCPEGRATNRTAAVTCDECALCSYAPTKGSAQCISAPSGYVTDSNRTTVYACPAGYYANAQTCECVACVNNTYAPFEGTAVCVECPNGYITNGTRAATECVRVHTHTRKEYTYAFDLILVTVLCDDVTCVVVNSTFIALALSVCVCVFGLGLKHVRVCMCGDNADDGGGGAAADAKGMARGGDVRGDTVVSTVSARDLMVRIDGGYGYSNGYGCATSTRHLTPPPPPVSPPTAPGMVSATNPIHAGTPPPPPPPPTQSQRFYDNYKHRNGTAPHPTGRRQRTPRSNTTNTQMMDGGHRLSNSSVMTSVLEGGGGGKQGVGTAQRSDPTTGAAAGDGDEGGMGVKRGPQVQGQEQAAATPESPEAALHSLRDGEV